jgi:DUF4097 and DUF4098 domain-containing protein YvlB
MASWEFPGSDPIDVHIDLTSGSVAIAAEPTEVSTVTLLPTRPGHDADEMISNVRVSFENGRLEIISPKRSELRRHHGGLDLTVKVPARSRCTVRTASADLSCVGELGSLDASTASGDVTAAVVEGPVQLSAASGDIWLEQALQGVMAHSASGDIKLLRAAGDIDLDSASGDIQVGTANGALNTRSASGDVRVDCFTGGVADVNSVSGDVTVAVTPGVGVYLDISSFTGDVSSDLDHDGRSDDDDRDDGDDGDAEITVKCKTVSGDIHITRGQPEPAR